MSSANSSINQIYKSRKNILEILNDKGYEVDEHIDFSVNEIDAMLNNNQLDMLLKTKDDKKVYIKYSLTSKQVRWQNTLDETIEDLYYIDNTLTKNDDLIIIINEEPNDNLINKLKYIYDTDGIFIVVHNIARLQFNILKHTLVPECTVLDSKEKEEMLIKYNINNERQLPEIPRFDPQALALCVRPGEICKFDRKSVNSMSAAYYRICV
jgi:DNA-directed RNA polymerase subunit H (RpoH/RPB5)